MMKGIVFLFICLCMLNASSNAQQRIDPKAMNYLMAPKPNNIIYNDTIFKGSSQFQQLFYRTHNFELIELYQRHQSNKITGQVMGVLGTLATIFGLSIVSSDRTGKRTGWIMMGTGLATSITGGYLMLMGQRNLQMAVILFNQQNNKAALGVGISNSHAGLVYKF